MSFSKGQRLLVLIVAVIVSLILMSMDRWFFDSIYAVLAILCIAAGIWFFRWGAKKPEAHYGALRSLLAHCKPQCDDAYEIP